VAYVNYILHLRQIEEKVTVEGVNQWAEMKMPGLMKQFETRHPATAKKLFEKIQQSAVDKINALRGEVKETPQSKLSKDYLKFQEQLYSKDSSLDLDKWAFATQMGRGRMADDEQVALDHEISERRAELQAIEAEQKE
jgi:hypothetical protein